MANVVFKIKAAAVLDLIGVGLGDYKNPDEVSSIALLQDVGLAEIEDGEVYLTGSGESIYEKLNFECDLWEGAIGREPGYFLDDMAAALYSGVSPVVKIPVQKVDPEKFVFICSQEI